MSRRWRACRCARTRLRKQVRNLNLVRVDKVPTDAALDGDDFSDAVELQGMDSRGCSVVAAAIVAIALAGLTAAHVVISMLS